MRDGEDPGNVYTIAQGGRVGVTLTAESTDGVDGCNPADSELVDIMPEAGQRRDEPAADPARVPGDALGVGERFRAASLNTRA